MNHKHNYKHMWPLLLVILPIMVVFIACTQTSAAKPTLQTTKPVQAVTATPSPTPNGIDRVMYFNSQPRDANKGPAGAPHCAMSVQDGRIVFADGLTNPAMSCPDLFAWRLFLEAVTQEFWKNWATDEYTWPQMPLPMCQDTDKDHSKCCSLNSLINPGYANHANPAINCPYYPGDHLVPNAVVTNTVQFRLAKPPFLAHTTLFSTASNGNASRSLMRSPPPGLTIRQEMSEIVFRNKPLFAYVFSNNLYNREGLGEVFKNNSQNMESKPPYRQRNQPGALTTIEFPLNSIMLKTDWLSEEEASRLGIKNDPANPYITMELQDAVLDNNSSSNQFKAGLYYLVSFHVSSKDIPNWVWATFEHVDNPGRCDYTGCNDSFGYQSPDTVGQDQYANFTEPHTITDGLVIASTIFDNGKTYKSGPRSALLTTLFQQLGIGSQASITNSMPAITDKGWLSYRLKGTQVDFTDATGRPTMLGNSVTEAGFVNTSSCISCHARAATNAEGKAPLSVFIPQLSEVGYAQSNNGAPNPDWYYVSDPDGPALLGLQTDFVWGFLGAKPITTTVYTKK